MADKAVEQDRNAKKCWSCGAIYVGHFCTDCGAKAQETITFCPVCGADRVKGKAFCGNCGFDYGDTGDYVEGASISTVGIPTFTPQEGAATSKTEGSEVSQGTPKQAPPKKPADKKPATPKGQNKGWASFLPWLQSHKVLAICAVAFVVVAVALGLIIGLSGKGDQPFQGDQPSQGISYQEMVDGTITITGMGTCTDTELIIPKTIDGYAVTSIDFEAFRGAGLTSVTIPNSVTDIGNYAFYDCQGLTSITLGDSVTSIGDCAFGYCTGLTSVIIPSSVTSIGQQAFYGCTGLTSITIPDGVTSIETETFLGCIGLTSVIIPSSVTNVDHRAFYDCTGLTSVTLLDGVESIGYEAFLGCTDLTSIVIPDSVADIGYFVFEGCKNLNTIYCEATTKPGGWSDAWNFNCSAQVVWGYEE